MRPAGVSTSTIGSSQKSPREPLRTISISRLARRAASRIAAATLSAPTATAAASPGTKMRVIIVARASMRRCAPSRAAPSVRRPASPTARRRTGQGNRSASTVTRPSGAVAPMRGRVASSTLCERIAPASTGRPRRGRASAHDGRPARGGSRDRTRRRHAPRRARGSAPRRSTARPPRHVAECRLHGVQDRQQRTVQVQQLPDALLRQLRNPRRSLNHLLPRTRH